MKRVLPVVVMLLALAMATNAYAAKSDFPKITEVHNGEGGVRIDVTRPSNASPDAPTTARARAIPSADSGPNVSISSTLPTYGATDSTPPTKILVAMFNGAQYLGTNEVTFYDAVGSNDYLQNVLPNEWPCLWPAEAVKAGAIATKMYGWYHVLVPKFSRYGAHVDNTTDSQVYVPGSAHSSCTSAIRNLAHTGLRRYYEGAPENAYVFETSYCAGDYADDRTIPCEYSTSGNFLTQNGSHYWADQGYPWSSILTLYYRATSPDTQGFFSY